MFSIAGESLTKRIRSQSFKAMLSQDIAWFDQPENSIGSLSTKLSIEATAIQSVSLIFYPSKSSFDFKTYLVLLF
jgi:ATP-binding cassette subfamily B (MDR/TAP) protein 1